MSNIIKNENDIKNINIILEKINKNGIDNEVLESLLDTTLPKKDNNKLINYYISKSIFNNIAQFNPQNKCIALNPNNINKWLDSNTNDFYKYLEKTDKNILKNYLLLFMITHEIEHSYQYLMSKNIIESKTDIISNGYKYIFELFDNKSIIPRPIKDTRKNISLLLYKKNENNYILERNANIESLDLITKISQYNDQIEINELFNDMKILFLKQGYINNNIGTLEETYKKILMYDKYKNFIHNTNLNNIDRINLGLNINEEERKELLKKKIKRFK